MAAKHVCSCIMLREGALLWEGPLTSTRMVTRSCHGFGRNSLKAQASCTSPLRIHMHVGRGELVRYTRQLTTSPVSVNRHMHRCHQLLDDNVPAPCCFRTLLLVCTGLGMLPRLNMRLIAHLEEPQRSQRQSWVPRGAHQVFTSTGPTREQGQLTCQTLPLTGQSAAWQ